jgi:hypothetical protein
MKVFDISVDLYFYNILLIIKDLVYHLLKNNSRPAGCSANTALLFNIFV